MSITIDSRDLLLWRDAITKTTIAILRIVFGTAVLLAACTAPIDAHGQAQAPGGENGPGLVLREIVHDYNDAYTLEIDRMDVNAREGYVEFTVGYSGDCVEQYRFAYRFDQDMSALDFVEGHGTNARQYGFDMSLKVLNGGCNRGNWNPSVAATSSDGGFSGILNKKFKTEPDKDPTRIKRIGGGSPSVYAYPGQGLEHVGSARGAFVTYDHNPNYESSYTWLGFKISAIGSYEVGFIYQQEN